MLLLLSLLLSSSSSSPLLYFRAAARCNKGFDVLYTVSQEHFISVAVRINRGPPKADASLAKVQRVLHCQMCDERVFFPESHTPIGRKLEFQYFVTFFCHIAAKS